MDETPPDDILVQAAAADVDAFALLYRRHLHRVYSYLLSRVGNVQDAQDLTTQTFIAVLQGIRSYKANGMFGAWLLGIARHKAIDHFRSKSPVVSLEDVDPLADAAPSPDEMMLERSQMQEISRLLDRLNPDRAEVLRLRYFGDLKIREVAQVMDKSEGAVKMLVARALEDMRRMLPVEEET